MSRRWWVLALLFVALPTVEIYLLVQLGQAVGPLWTIFLLLAAGVLGAYLVRREGSRAWRALQEALGSGRMPAKELADGALVLVGGTLLLTPGFVSDAVGLFCILPLTRPVARTVLTRVIARRLASGLASGPASFRPSPGSAPRDPRTDPRTSHRPGHDDVVRGEVVDDEPG